MLLWNSIDIFVMKVVYKFMKIAIIGAGNIGGAMARGLMAKGAAEPSSLTLTTAHEQSLAKYAGLGCKLTTDNRAAARGADIVVLAVKPWLIPDVADEIKDVLSPGHQTVVSLAAGVDNKALSERLGEGVDLVCVIPNTAIEIGESVTFLCPVNISGAGLDEVRSLFDRLGRTFVVDEAHLQAGTALASCGIAFAMRYARAATEGGVQLGFKPEVALEMVEQTVVGAMKLMEAHGSHPEVEIDRVTTPGGITIKGLNAMEEAGFTNAVIKGLKAAK